MMFPLCACCSKSAQRSQKQRRALIDKAVARCNLNATRHGVTRFMEPWHARAAVWLIGDMEISLQAARAFWKF